MSARRTVQLESIVEIACDIEPNNPHLLKIREITITHPDIVTVYCPKHKQEVNSGINYVSEETKKELA